MSTHPNAMLLLTLTPDDLARKTYRNIQEFRHLDDSDDDHRQNHLIKIGNKKYHHMVMESDYSEAYQISASEGDIVLWDLFTYGYGDVMKWDDLEKQKIELEQWAKVICDKFHCTYQIFVTANYW